MITEEDIAASLRARGKIAILQAKMQDIITKSEAQLANKRDAMKAIEVQRDADLAAIQAKINDEEAAIKGLIANV
jgi:hypothetical protein